jgi:hypothetical protein
VGVGGTFDTEGDLDGVAVGMPTSANGDVEALGDVVALGERLSIGVRWATTDTEGTGVRGTMSGVREGRGVRVAAGQNAWAQVIPD